MREESERNDMFKREDRFLQSGKGLDIFIREPVKQRQRGDRGIRHMPSIQLAPL